jgi:hypothetical protein
VGTNRVVCAALDQCHAAGTCDPTTGACSNPAAPDGTACNDGNACTQADACAGGACVGMNPIACTALDQCHSAGACDPATGTCSNPALADGTACSDGNACTHGETCQAGVCGMPLTNTTCPAADACREAGVCDSMTGLCVAAPKPAHTTCDDGNACTTGDVCLGDGTCLGTPIICDTPPDPTCADRQGTCMAGGCTYTIHVGAMCDDGDPNTSGDACGADGLCHGTPIMTGGQPIVPSASVGTSSSGGCAVDGRSAASTWLTVLVALWLVHRRRRSRAPR